MIKVHVGKFLPIITVMAIMASLLNPGAVRADDPAPTGTRGRKEK